MIQSTRLAKAVYRAGRLLHHVKRPVRVYTMGPDRVSHVFARWQWRALNSCFTLLAWAQSIDREHFEHWAYFHYDCNSGNGPHGQCYGCGSQVCPASPDDDE